MFLSKIINLLFITSISEKRLIKSIFSKLFIFSNILGEFEFKFDFFISLKESSPSNSFNDVLKKSLDKLKSKLTITVGKKKLLIKISSIRNSNFLDILLKLK